MVQQYLIKGFLRINLLSQSPQYLKDPLFHFLRGLIGKCHGEDMLKGERVLQGNLQVFHCKGISLAGTCRGFVNGKKLLRHDARFINRIYGIFYFICRNKTPVMFFYLSQFLSFLVMPLTLVILLFLSGMIFSHRRVVLWLGFALLLFFSNLFLANYVMYLWEPEYKGIDDLPEFEIGIVLTGVTNLNKTAHDRTFFNKGADRATHAV